MPVAAHTNWKIGSGQPTFKAVRNGRTYSSDIKTAFLDMRHSAIPDLLREALGNQVGHGGHSGHGIDACAGGEEGCIRHVQVADLHSMRKDGQQLRNASFWQPGQSLGGHKLPCCARP